MKKLSWKDEETALLQLIIDYILISCIVSFAEAEAMTIAETNGRDIALIFKCRHRCSDFK